MTDDQIIDEILRREGGYVDHPADPGGPTRYGITLATLADWRRTPQTAADVQALTEADAREIYRARYLAPFDDLTILKPHAVDIAVNSGVTTARAMVARAMQQRRRSPATQLVVERLRHYARLVKEKPAKAVFLEGWINRALDFLE